MAAEQGYGEAYSDLAFMLHEKTQTLVESFNPITIDFNKVVKGDFALVSRISKFLSENPKPESKGKGHNPLAHTQTYKDK